MSKMDNVKVEKLKKFIKENNIEIAPGHRNEPLTVLSGYALYLYCDVEEVKKALKGQPHGEDSVTLNELERVFEYAKDGSYGCWWEKEDAKLEYKF